MDQSISLLTMLLVMVSIMFFGFLPIMVREYKDHKKRKEAAYWSDRKLNKKKP